MAEQHKYEMNISLNVLNHLGINLYSNIPAVLSEIIANAWDADADEVSINIDADNKIITIIDNGTGMTVDDINDKFLNVGYSKRESGHSKTKKYTRDVMGRKGIGKLSMFSIAKHVEITTIKDGTLSGFELDTDEIEKSMRLNNGKYNPKEISVEDFGYEHGTKIVLTALKKNINELTNTYIKKRIARRFSIIGSAYNFVVKVDSEEVNITDRDYFHKVQYLWNIGSATSYTDLCKHVEEVETFEDKIKLNGDEYTVSGWLGLTNHSGDLQDGDDNLNKIVLMVRNKLAQEDILEEFREGGMYTKFLFGEIHADFLDLDNNQDIATSSRQKIIEDDPRYLALKAFVLEKLKIISAKRVEFKNAAGLHDAMQYPSIVDWFGELKGDTKKKAKQLFGKINQIATDSKHQKQLFKHGVLAFESLRTREALDALEDVDISHLENFMSVFIEFDDIEKTLYHEITTGRLQIISKLKENVDEDVLEKVLQEYLYEHLWLLDPSWDRVKGNVLLEQQVSKAFNEVSEKLSDDEKKGRMDIKYIKTSGTHVIVELKRASVSVDSDTLLGQVKKYIRGLQKQLELVGKGNEAIQAVCILGKNPSDFKDASTSYISNAIEAAKVQGVSIVTYQQLIHDSYEAYKIYLDSTSEQGRILKLLRNIEAEMIE